MKIVAWFGLQTAQEYVTVGSTEIFDNKSNNSCSPFVFSDSFLTVI